MKLSFTPHATSALAAVALLLAGCGTVASSPTPAPRPSTTATVEIVAPASGAIVEGASAHVVLKLTGARIITETTTDIRPDEGHVHLYVNGLLVSMNYGLEQDIPVQPGTLVIKAEFVAADHVPFSPRVWSAENVFTVRR